MFDERYIFGDMYVKSYTLEYGPNLYASATKGVRTSKNGWIMARWFGANAPNRNPEPTPGFIHYFLETQCGGSGKRCDAEALFCPGDMVQALAHSDVLHPSLTQWKRLTLSRNPEPATYPSHGFKVDLVA